MSITTMIKTIQDIMRKDPGIDGDAQRIGQLAWMVFLKIVDDYEYGREHVTNYLSPIPENLRWRNWATLAGFMTDDALIDFVNDNLFPCLKTLSTGKEPHSLTEVIQSVFEDAHNYMKSGALMRQVIDKIAYGIDFKSYRDRHLFGDVYEQILRDLQSAGNAGEYYTPRAVTQFMVQMVDPKLGEIVLDPACGTGGFLTCSIQHIRHHYVKTGDDERILQQSITGVEKKPLPHMLCVTNMLLHGIDVPDGIRHDNLLSRRLNDYTATEQVDVIVTNPPFGGSEEDGIENNFPEEYRTRETADLFLTLIIHLLKSGGRAAILLPDSLLFGENAKARIKEQLLMQCDLHTIVRLPKGVFSPYTDITTNILFLAKGRPTTTIWYYEHPYPFGYKSYSKTKPIRFEEFTRESEWWFAREPDSCAWSVSINEVADRGYNLDIKNPHHGESSHIDVGILVKEYQELASEIAHIQDYLKRQFSYSLATGKYEQRDIVLGSFGVLGESEYGLRKLRELVLHLAMRGKLTPQCSDDEPATRLLQRLIAERERLVRAGVIRGTYPLPTVNDERAPFPIPDTWIWVRIGEVAQVVGGGTPPTRNGDFFADDGIPWLTPADLYSLRGKYIGRGKRDLSELGLQKSSARLLPTGAVLFSSRAPIGYVAIAANDVSTNQGFKSLVPFHMAMNEFIYYYLLAARAEIEQSASGTTFKEVSGKRMQRLLFPLPPLAEQQRIVEEVDRLMQTIDSLEAKLEPSRLTYRRLTDSLVHHIVAS